MLDLKTEILYGEKYLEIFIRELAGTNIDESEKKYNIKRINEHLEKILKEYTQMTNELDEIIFSKNKNQKICSICGKNYEGYGNNAQPVNNGRCCDKCNATVVIPRRIQEHQNRKKGDILYGKKRSRIHRWKWIHKKRGSYCKKYKEIAKIKNIRAFCTTADQKHDLFVDDKYNMYVTE